MEPQTPDERFVADAVRALGFDVTRVEPGAASSCDFVIRDAQTRYLLEIKSRTNPEELWATTKRGEIYDSDRELDRSRRLEAIADDAMKQLKETHRREAADYLLLAFVVRPVFSPRAEFRRVKGTLYGVQELFDVAQDFSSLKPLTCLYFRESRFFRHKDLNGAIVSIGRKQGTLFVNDHAANAERFRRSKLYREFEATHALFDPAHATRERGYLIADFDMPRSDPGVVQRAVRLKYGLDRLVLAHSVEWSAAVAIPREDST